MVQIGAGPVVLLSGPGVGVAGEDLRVAKGSSHRSSRLARDQAATGRVDRASGSASASIPESLPRSWSAVDRPRKGISRRGPTKDLLVFDSYARGGPETSFVDIGTVPTTCPSLQACTASIRWVTDNGATGRRNANPQWSPDGTSLVFTDRAGVDEPNAEIWTIRYPSSDRRKISTSTNFDYRPTWGPRR